MSGSIASPFLTPNELLAPRNFALQQEQQALRARAQDVDERTLALNEQKQAAALDLADQAQIANVAGYLLGLPDEAARAKAWDSVYANMPDHVRARAPATYQGEGYLRAVQARAIPALEQWKLQQQLATNLSIMGGTGGGGAPAAGAPAAPDTSGYGAGGPAASLQVPPAFRPYFEEASRETGIPVDRLIAQGRQESGFNPNATGAAGEIGVMQIKPSTASDPGFGMTGVDPASLRDPRANILFGARYLKARMGQGDPADPATWQRGLLAYNGGGDPNYVANVTRYAPVPRGVAARTGGVDVAGPGVPPSGPAAPDLDPGGAGAPTGSAMAPDVLARVRTLAGAGSAPNALAAPPGAVPTADAPDAPAAPARGAQGAPASVMAPEQIAASLGIDPQSGLTARDTAVLRASAGRLTPDQFATLQEQMRTRNLARVQQVFQQQRDDAKDARQAQKDAVTLPLEQAKLEDERRKAERARQAEAEPEFQGQGADIQDFHILRYRDPKSPEYHQAYARQANPRVGEGGLVIYPNMGAYRMPLDEDGQPVTTYDQPRFSVGPGSLQELRKLETQASALTSALDDFAATAKKASTGEKLATLSGASTDLRSAWVNAGLMAKGEALYALGVLSGPDMSIIRGALADPSTFMGSMASGETIDKQVARIKRLLQTRIDQARQSYGGGMSATGGARPAGSGATSGGPNEPVATTSNADPIAVTSAADYAKVPPGGLYVDPQGNTRRKR